MYFTVLIINKINKFFREVSIKKYSYTERGIQRYS